MIDTELESNLDIPPFSMKIYPNEIIDICICLNRAAATIHDDESLTDMQKLHFNYFVDDVQDAAANYGI